MRLPPISGCGGCRARYAGVNVFRLRQSTREHLAILDQLESRQFEVAADLLRVHLRLSRSQRPQAASRGAPALFGTISAAALTRR